MNQYESNHYDVAVIGGSAAGLSAALVLTRARRSVVVIDSGSPRNAPATHMHGFLSRDGMNPADLLEVGRDEVKGYGGELLAGAVTELIPNGHQGFWALLGDGRRLGARKVLVATGLRDELPAIAGLADGPETSCTARTVTGTRSRTGGSAFSVARRAASATPRSSGSGATTWCTSPRRTP